jgi:O-antigen/teichoic acid export membrane protein
MKVYAAVAIIDTVLKLAIVYIVMIGGMDKLKLYALLTFVVAVIIRMIYTAYCKAHFKECIYRFSFDKDLFRQMFSFAGWNFFSNFSISLKNQGSAIILNIFFGTAINAACGIAYQVKSVITSFAGNFQIAINPQITKTYAAGDYEQTQLLIARGCRYSFFLLAVLTIPVYINIKYILSLWLTVIPDYTETFIRLIIWISVLDSMARPIVTAILATGDVRKLSSIVGGIFLLEIPVSCLLLELGYLPYSVLYVTLFTTAVCVFVRFFIMKERIAFSWRYFVFSVFLKNMIMFSMLILILQYIQSMFTVNFLSFVAMSLLSMLFTVSVFYLIGLEKKEKKILRKSILNFMKLQL